MNVQCPKCFSLTVADLGRYPPWCKKCGVDVKPHEYIPVGILPVELPPEPPAPAVDPQAPSSVTGTGPKNWLKGKVAPPPAAEPAPAAEPTPARPEAPDFDSHAYARLSSTFGRVKTAGVVVLLVAGLLAGDAWAFNKNCRETTGRVLLKSYSSPGSGVVVRLPRLEFVADAKVVDVGAAEADEGRSIPLVYEVKNPTNVRRGTAASQYTLPALLALVGGGLIAFAVVRIDQLRQAHDRALAVPGE
jgi:hypothetical protein